MKKCNNCNKILSETGNFCPDCGSPLVDVAVCLNCGNETENTNAEFCSVCGSQMYENTETQNKNVADNESTPVNRLKENEFFKSVKSDFQNSQSVNLVKEKVKDTAQNVKTKTSKLSYYQKKKIGIIAGICAVIVVLVVLATSIHTCDECDKTYLGKKHTVTFWGETENLCKDCYNDFYSWGF